MKILYLWVLANSGCGRLLHLLHGDVLAIGGRRGRRLLYQQGTTDQQSSKHQRHRRRLTHGVRPDLLLSGDRSVEAWFCVLVGPQDSKYRRDSPATPSAGGAIAGIPQATTLRPPRFTAVVVPGRALGRLPGAQHTARRTPWRDERRQGAIDATPIEVVERKGLAHTNSLRANLSDGVSRALFEYLHAIGRMLSNVIG